MLNAEKTLVTGRPNVRGHFGFAFLWGEGWSEEIQDGALGGCSIGMANPPVTFELIYCLIYTGPGKGMDCQPYRI